MSFGKKILCLILVVVSLTAVMSFGVSGATGLVIRTHPTDQTIRCKDTFVYFSVSAVGEGLTYKWYSDNGNGVPMEVGNSKSLTILPHEGNFHYLDGYEYYCVVTDKNGISVKSKSASVTVEFEKSYSDITAAGHKINCADCGKQGFKFESHLPGPAATEESAQYCLLCNYEIAKQLEHICVFEDEYTSDGTYHWKECKSEKCDKTTEKVAHVPGPAATEENAQYCTVCEYMLQDKLPHVCRFGEEYVSDGTYHWKECLSDKCELTNGKTAHIPGAPATEENAQYCTVCDYLLVEKLEHVHSYSLVYKTDPTYHWKECRCGDKKELAAHVPGPAATEESAQVCTVCNYVLAQKLDHIHDFSGKYIFTNAGHSRLCECGAGSPIEPHTPGAPATDITAQTCTACGYEVAPKLPHTHAFGTQFKYDANYHWNECACGEPSTRDAHLFPSEPVIVVEATEDAEGECAYICSVCAYRKVTPIPKLPGGGSGNTTMTVAIIIISVIVVAACGAVVMMVISKKRR